MHLRDDERAALLKLAEQYEAGQPFLGQEDVMQVLGIESEPEYIRVVKALHAVGAFEKVTRTSDGAARSVKFSPDILALARQVEAEENQPPDIPEQIKRWARRHPVWGTAIVVVAALLTLVTLANQGAELLDKLGLIDLDN